MQAYRQRDRDWRDVSDGSVTGCKCDAFETSGAGVADSAPALYNARWRWLFHSALMGVMHLFYFIIFYGD